MRRKLTPAFAAKATTVPGASGPPTGTPACPASGLWLRRTVTELRGAVSRRRPVKAHAPETRAHPSDRPQGSQSDPWRRRQRRRPAHERRKAERAESDTLRAIVEEYLTREGSRFAALGSAGRA